MLTVNADVQYTLTVSFETHCYKTYLFYSQKHKDCWRLRWKSWRQLSFPAVECVDSTLQRSSTSWLLCWWGGRSFQLIL